MNSQLTGQDALFFNVDRPHAPSYCTLVAIYEPSAVHGERPGFRDIVRHVGGRLDASPVFRQRIVRTSFGLGYPHWVEDALFDIDFHLRHAVLPAPGDWRQLCDAVARIQADALDLTRAPWEMHVIDGLDAIDGLPRGSFAIVTRVHHAVLDGAAAAELIRALHDFAGDRPDVAEAPHEHQPPPGPLESVARTLGDNLAAAARLGMPLARLLPRLAAAGLRSAAFVQGAPRTRFNVDISARRVWDLLSLDLEDVQRIKRSVPGATLNDVALALVGGALRRYLLARDELPARSLVALAPVNTRRHASEKRTSGNSVSMLRVPLGTDIEDPLARLRAVHEASVEAKTLHDSLGPGELTNLQKLAPPAALALAGRVASLTGLGGRGPFPLHNCMVSNVPGPREPLHLLGARLVRLGGVGPLLDGLSLFFNPTSYCGKLFISVTSTPEVLPDPEFMLRCLQESFEEAL